MKQHSKEDPWITRIDYAVDLFYNKDTILVSRNKMFKSINKSSNIRDFGNWRKAESWSLGSKSSKRVFIRMYDKLLDTQWKWKYSYYKDYYKFRDVHRFEVQYMAHFTRWFTLSWLDMLLVKIRSSLQITKEVYNWLMFYQYSVNNDINDFNRLAHTKVYVTKAKKFYNAWLNPYTMIYTGFIQDQEINKDKHFDYIEEFLKILPVKRF